MTSMQSATADPGTRAALAALPKIDLHRHLEGSLRLSSLQSVALAHGLDLPAGDIESLRPYVQVTNDEPSFQNFLAKFVVLRRFYRSPEVIQQLAYEVVEDAARDNVRYLELRFTPVALAMLNGYPLAEVADWVLEATQAASRDNPGIQVRLIASVNRHEPVAVAEDVLRIAVDRRDKGIVAIDLAGDEANYTSEPFEALFREARQSGLGIVAHAGEWTGAAEVRYAIQALGVGRIGHGVRVVEDESVVALARDCGVVFEVCPTSNLHSGVVGRLQDHPLRNMVRLGLKTTINSDDPAVSNISLTEEYLTVVEDLGFEPGYVAGAILTAAGAAFLPPEERLALAESLQGELAAFTESFPIQPQPRG
jgi:adenosine deaminase